MDLTLTTSTICFVSWKDSMLSSMKFGLIDVFNFSTSFPPKMKRYFWFSILLVNKIGVICVYCIEIVKIGLGETFLS